MTEDRFGRTGLGGSMKKLAFGLALVAFALATVAVAGSSSNQQVAVWTDANGLTNANGTFLAARHSPDTTQYIGCSLYAYDTGSYSATCYAYSATYQYASCYTSNAQML